MSSNSRNSNIYLATLTNLGYFSIGTSAGWTSTVMPRLRNVTADSPLKIGVNYQQEGWISSILSIGAIVGSALAGPLANRIGRKWALLTSGLLSAAGYFLFLVSSTIWHIYVGRFLQGLATGLVCTVMPMYIAETSTDETRGPLCSMITLFANGGILFVYTTGAFMTYLKLQFSCLAIPIIFLGVFFFMPETPYFYAMKRRKSEAVKSLSFLRCRCGTSIEDEIKQIQSSVDTDMSKKGTLVDILRDSSNRRAFFICCGLAAFQELSGIDVISFNSESIFIKANTSLKPEYASICLALVQVATCLVNPFFIKRLDRKTILSISAIGQCISLIALGTFFYIQDFGDASAIRWIPISSLLLFSAMHVCGLGPVTWIVLSEILHANIKGTVSSFAATLNAILTFVLTRFYPDINELGTYYVFWIFGGLCGLALIFIVFYVIETKGLTFQEIQEKLNRS